MEEANLIAISCNKGLALERKGDHRGATIIYAMAWGNAINDTEKCIAAHFVARIQESLHGTLHWNLESLRYAQLVKSNDIKTYLPSLYFNIGTSYEALDNQIDANKFFDLAVDALQFLPSGQRYEEYNIKLRTEILDKSPRVQS